MNLANPLLSWYDKCKRDFPWRNHNFKSKDEHAYHTWICEVMSQQTLLSVLLPKYLQFTASLPNITALAHCPEDKLRALWKGLGYYARARNLQKGARYILNNLNGKFPQTQKQWQLVNGCGPYTSSVIASICYNEPIIAVDGNVIRVGSRLLNISDNSIWNPRGQKKIFDFLQKHISKTHPGNMNQALMDLGATLCKKNNPNCNACPISTYCKSYELNTTHLCPSTKPRALSKTQTLFAIIFKNPGCNSKIALIKRQNGFLKGTFGFPLNPNAHIWTKAYEYLKNIKGTAVLCKEKFSHSITHHKIKGCVIIVESTGEKSVKSVFSKCFDLKEDINWVDANRLNESLSSSLDQKIYKIWRLQE